jgi:deazaflavin-dependent oxidoreductase (nitroreductase family)
MADINDWNAKIIAEFRANGGKVGGQFEGAPLLLLHTVGAKSGEPRVSPMMYAKDDDRYLVFASFAGNPKSPAWYFNLKANPDISVEVASADGAVETFTATAVETQGAERDALYARQAELYPGFAEYEAMTDRVIPVVALIRQ